MRLIDADVLIENIVETAKDLRTLSTKTIGEAIHKTPTVDAVPVAMIGGRINGLKKMLIGIDEDEVDEIWILRTQIETLTDMLEMWAERKEE